MTLQFDDVTVKIIYNWRLRLSESTKCRSNLQLALLAIAVLSNQVLWKKCALVFALNGLSNWMPISGGIFQQKVMISSIKSTIFFVMWFVFLLFSLQKLIITLWSLGHRLHLALHKGLKIGNYLIASTTKVANLTLLTIENKGDHLEGHHWAEKEYTHAWKKWNRQIWDERPLITWLLWMRKSKF